MKSDSELLIQIHHRLLRLHWVLPKAPMLHLHNSLQGPLIEIHHSLQPLLLLDISIALHANRNEIDKKILYFIYSPMKFRFVDFRNA